MARSGAVRMWEAGKEVVGSGTVADGNVPPRHALPFISRLVRSFSGTVTRTSEVRPELTQGMFQCEVCGTVSDLVTQQFKYCEPVKCKNAVRAGAHTAISSTR